MEPGGFFDSAGRLKNYRMKIQVGLSSGGGRKVHSVTGNLFEPVTVI
jgi:hypothetical protein